MQHRDSVVIIVQARTGSQRLPGKVLLPLAGKSSLVRQVERLRRCRYAAAVVVATTHLESDDIIESLCHHEGILCFRGHPTDLLDRHYQCARAYGATTVVKVPSDCPLIDPVIVDTVIEAHLRAPRTYDYVSNLHPATFPDGNDVELITLTALERAWNNACKQFQREHTTPYIWDNPHLFRIGNIVWKSGMDYSMSHRWTLDYEADYHFIRTVYDELYDKKPDFGLNDILWMLNAKPEIARINSVYAGVNWYAHHLDELTTVGEHHTRILIQ
ncbi:MAG: glycosyltransferase family protein [Candidatus Kapabacteria bacterium]|nr:glycosyltransferase family protein [Candidatus Kapabacteria bacterium]